jgi:C-terminal processing protease CtpA/Prc
LQTLKRATIIGERTGGGAHVGRSQRIHYHFEVSVPAGRAISPISKANWEGTGVSPDMSVPAEMALKTAHMAALTKLYEDLSARKKDPKAEVNPSRVDQLSKALAKMRTDMDPVRERAVRRPPRDD